MVIYLYLFHTLNDTMSGRVVALVPAYNEENRIASVLVELGKVVDMIIVCDDGSSDLTGEIAEALGATLIRHDKNLGYGASLRSLFKAAQDACAEIAVTIDADGQHLPEELPRLVDMIRESGCDVVIGSRFLQDNDIPELRKRGIEVINSVLGDVTDSQSGFRAYSRRALEVLDIQEDGMAASTEILIQVSDTGLSVCEVPITVLYLGDSFTYGTVSHGVGVLFSTLRGASLRRPLVLYGAPGVVSLVLSVFMWLFTYSKYRDTEVFSAGLGITSLSLTLVGLSLVTMGLVIWVNVKASGNRVD